MLGKPMIYATEIIAILVISFQLPIAQATGFPITPWPVQAGAIVILGTLLLVQMTKVGPAESKRRSEELDRMLEVHRETSVGISDNVKEMTGEIKAMNCSTKALMEHMRSLPCQIVDPVKTQ